MKRLICLMAAVILLAGTCPALAATHLNPTEDRGIVPAETELNPVIPGESPTTGRKLSAIQPANRDYTGLAVTGRYLPMLVQIDNTDNGAKARAPWGAASADIVYESPLRREGQTRISLLFSDLIPDDVGPVRSARLGHVWLREEWGAGFLFYGQQEYPLTNVLDEFSALGASKSGLLFSGTEGKKKWSKLYYKRKKLVSPHDKGANAAAMSQLVAEDYTAPNHTWLFTNEPAQGDPAGTVMVDWGRSDYYAEYRWSPTVRRYLRYVHSGEGLVYADYDTNESITFSNVIIQWTDVDWVTKDAPVTHNTGDAAFFADYGGGNFTAGGNADYFMNGVHVAGVWRREGMSSRTVFYGPDGQEIRLQRGRTMVIMFPAVERQIKGAGQAPEVINDVYRSVSYK
ncbi:MAG: DUF3048 domain-containing protein [Clostridia bacterium]|nr:DUF3048 domain-containing protein [Clostridia bacterium]